MRLVTAFLSMTLLASVARAGDVIPLIPDLRWIYEDPAGNVMTVTTLGWTEFAGATCMQMRVDYTGPHAQTTDQFRSRGPEGQIYFHGAAWEEGSIVYAPPMLEYEPPFEVGDTWSTEIEVYGVLRIFAFRIASYGPVFVPYGAFDAYRLEFLSGDDWWPAQIVVPGIGEIERGPFELVAYGPLAPVDQRSWTEVKALFR